VEPHDPAIPYLPTLERARAEGLALPPHKPAEERRVAALVVLAQVMRREAWDEETDLGPDALKQIERGDPPLPAAFEARSHRRLVDELGARRCTMCQEASGRARCRICNGAGTLGGRACSCEGGFVRCALCEGSGWMMRARLRYLQDQPLCMRELYAPPEMSFVSSLFTFEGTLERIVGPADPPEALRCHDLRPRATATAYRGAGDRVVEPDFHGHRFAGTIDKAVSALAQLSAGGRVVAQAVRAYAWPLLWLRYGPGAPAPEAVVFPDPTGALHLFVGRVPGPS